VLKFSLLHDALFSVYLIELRREAKAVALKERSPVGLKIVIFRAIDLCQTKARPLLSQPDSFSFGFLVSPH
jgi:hypothetical protein